MTIHSKHIAVGQRRSSERYETHRFESYSIGFIAPGDTSTAVCMAYDTKMRLEGIPERVRRAKCVSVQDNVAFFAGLSRVKRIVVMGHSVSDVDHPYFREVIRNIDADRVTWKISYFGDLDGLRESVKRLDIAPPLVEFALLANF